MQQIIGNVKLVVHPVAQDALMTLRDKSTDPETFQRATTRITTVLANEALLDLLTEPARVETPVGPASGRCLAQDVVVVAVLRAGLAMLDAVQQLVPKARVGHIGLQRNEDTAVASQYYAKLPPNLKDSYVLLVDPMLATGGSAVVALDLLDKAGARDIRMICIVAAPEGLALVEKHHPQVRVYTPVIDERLNGKKYIVPGLGDFGDRLYGTL